MKKTITYAIGDIHGCFEKLIALLAHCDAHSGSRKPRFVFLGDYVDRGPDSKRVVEFLMRGQSKFPDRFICLKGNHEQLLVSAANTQRRTNGPTNQEIRIGSTFNNWRTGIRT